MPKIIGATHYHEIFEQNFLQAGPRLAFGHMEIHLDKNAENIEDQVSCLYKFVLLKPVLITAI